MYLGLTQSNIIGLDDYTSDKLAQLINVYNKHESKNNVKDRYYEGSIRLRDVNLGIAVPDSFSRLEVGCAWGAKAVDVLAARSMFDGFVGSTGSDVEELDKIVEDNHLIAEYQKSCRDELKYGCTFATLSKDTEIGVKIRWHSPHTAAGIWNGEKGRLDCGFAVVEMVQKANNVWIPSIVNVYTDAAIWVLRYDGNYYRAEYYPHSMGRPLMEPLIWNATNRKPLGRSRIKEPVRRLIDGYVRTIANATLGLEFSTSPQKYLLGLTDEQYDAVINQKFKQYVGNILASTTNPETGEKPSFGQLQQGSITPHVEMIRVLATQFSAATGLSVTDTGVVNEANPTSSDAILAQSQTLIAMAQQLNIGNGDSLKNIALMALAISHGTNIEGLTEEQRDVIAHFKNPAMPSVAVTADAAIKIAAVRPNFAQTDVFAEMIGFDKADIRRIKEQERYARGIEVLSENL